MTRKVIKEDIPALKAVLDSCGLFPSELLDDMISDYLTNPTTEDIWFTTVQDEMPISVGYCAPEKFTVGTYNLYAIGVEEKKQGGGVGGRMMTFIEEVLRDRGGRVLIVETSGSSEFEKTRTFYLKNGYTHEATIREFWQSGEDKVIFWKKLS